MINELIKCREARETSPSERQKGEKEVEWMVEEGNGQELLMVMNHSVLSSPGRY